MATRDDLNAERLRVSIYRRMPPEQRLLIAARLFEEGVELVRASIRQQQPEISDQALRQAVRERVLPRGMARQVQQALAAHEPRRSEAGTP